MINNRIPSSFRDPSSFVFCLENKIFRSIQPNYKNEFNYLIESGLYNELTEKNYLIKHTFIRIDKDENQIIQPEHIPFISYPYEWSFEQIKDAALLTLKIQNIALRYNMSLKDASIYNVQFLNGKPIFIDTTSFEFNNDKPWTAYYQFCKHFLYPLWIMKYVSPELNSLYLSNLDGIDPKFTIQLMPIRAYFRLSVILHLLTPVFYRTNSEKSGSKLFSKEQHKRLLKHLFSIISSLHLPYKKSSWNQYYDNRITNAKYLESKELLVKNIMSRLSAGIVLDLGANDGHFSRFVEQSSLILSTDFDSRVVNENYIKTKSEKNANLLPLVLNICNPSPGIGWNNSERTGFFDRIEFDTVMALALIHHLVFSNNITLEMIAQKLLIAKNHLIIEFIPINDEKVKQITIDKKIDHIQYSENLFESSFEKYFVLKEKHKINGSERILYWYEKKA